MRRRSGARSLAAILFTDIVDSSTQAARMGDQRWKELIARHHAIVRRELKRYGGRELDTAGDGFFASFGEPAAAIRCACTSAETVRQLGIEIRTGVHFGECEHSGGKLGGLTVVVGARVMSLGAAGDVLITGTTRELIGGAGFGFEDRGRHALKGVEGEWHVFAVTEVDGAPRPPPIDAHEAEERRAAVQPARALRRRTGLLIAAVSLLIVAGTIALVLRAVGGALVLERIPADTVGRINPVTNEIESAVDVGSAPTGITVGGGNAWILSLEAGTLARVDLGGDQATTTRATEGHPTAVALDESGFVWVLNGFPEATLVRIDPNRMAIEETVELPTGTKDLAVGLGAAWVTNANERTLTRIDLVTRNFTRIDLSTIGVPGGVAIGEATVWVAGSERVARVDPGSLREIITWPLRFPAGQIAVGEGSVWATHLADDRVTRIDETTGPTTAIEVGNGPLDLAVGEGAVWVTNSLDGTVSRIDPKTNGVVQIRVDSSPEGVAIGDGFVWVTVHAL